MVMFKKSFKVQATRPFFRCPKNFLFSGTLQKASFYVQGGNLPIIAFLQSKSLLLSYSKELSLMRTIVDKSG